MQRLRALWLRRLMVALFIGSFVSVAAASIACQAACAYLSTDSHLSRAPEHHASKVPQSLADHEVPSRQAADHLKHGGPCQLAVVSPASLVEWSTGFAIARNWRGIAPHGFHSFISPPPEHRPRA